MTRLPSVVDLAEPPVVGESYLVPCVRLWHVGRHWLPVFGPRHADPDLGAPVEHYHYDLRFATVDGLRAVLYDREVIVSSPVDEAWLLNRALGVVPKASSVAEGPRLVSRVCLRAMPEQRLLRERLHAQYSGLSLKCGRCPHRGADLRSLPVAADGTIVCPLHGLQFDASTGRVVRRPRTAVDLIQEAVKAFIAGEATPDAT